ncbi:hypothetical protein [Rhodoligotrophos ferricapiens]|uniref:hypothetical protein n=1 Tax=Rhodoligotrophos ferricapiens TaxID=3069264 RepID=UPI00315C76A5
MNIETSESSAHFPELPRIQTIGQWMSAATRIGALVLPIGFIYNWVDPTAYLEVMARSQATDVANIGPTQTGGLFLLQFVLVGLQFYLLWQVSIIFGELKRGDIFSARSADAMMRAGFMAMLFMPIRIVDKTLETLLLTIGNEPGHRILAIGVGFEDFAMLSMGAVILAVGYIMGAARRQSRELESFV